MYKHVYTAMNANDPFADPPSTFFAGGLPVEELAPAFELKTVDETTILNLAARYETVHQGVNAIYPLSEIYIIISFSLM